MGGEQNLNLKKSAEWLVENREEGTKQDLLNIKEFVDCYLHFSGVAGKCDVCTAQQFCIGINMDNGHAPPSGARYYTLKGIKRASKNKEA